MDITIIEYETQFQPYFEQLNKDWLQEHFVIEPVDKWMLENPEEAILKNGGHILFAKKAGQIVGTVALKFVETGIYELAKMTVAKTARGLGLGKLLCEAALLMAQELRAVKVILYTNDQLTDAIHIYKKLGFVQVPIAEAEFVRANVMMELDLKSA